MTEPTPREGRGVRRGWVAADPVAASEPKNKFHGTGEWRITNDGSLLWSYVVWDPEGWMVGIAMTMRGARRMLRREKYRREHPKPVDDFWNRPTLYSEKP